MPISSCFPFESLKTKDYLKSQQKSLRLPHSNLIFDENHWEPKKNILQLFLNSTLETKKTGIQGLNQVIEISML